VLGRGRTALCAVAAAVLAGLPALDALNATIVRDADGYAVGVRPWPAWGSVDLTAVPPLAYNPYAATTGPTLVLLVAAGLVLLAVVARLDPPVRRRLLALAAPTVAAYGVVTWLLPYHSPLTAPQWTTLVGAPLVGLALAVLAVRRWESRRA
jgi:hypothetical protein